MLSKESIDRLIKLNPDATVKDALSLSNDQVDKMVMLKDVNEKYKTPAHKVFSSILIKAAEEKLTEQEIFRMKVQLIKNRSAEFDSNKINPKIGIFRHATV